MYARCYSSRRRPGGARASPGRPRIIPGRGPGAVPAAAARPRSPSPTCEIDDPGRSSRRATPAPGSRHPRGEGPRGATATCTARGRRLQLDRPPGVGRPPVARLGRPRWRPPARAATAGGPIGYFEHRAERSSTKIAIFGLLGGFHGRGLGGHALTLALDAGFELGPRVWLTTCSLDSPAALPNYLRARPGGVQGRGAAVVRRARARARSVCNVCVTCSSAYATFGDP